MSLSQGPLSSQHLRELKAARARSAKIRRAAAIALFNGWTLALAATFSLLMLLFDLSVLNALLVLALSAFATVEFRGAAGLRALHPASARTLGWNQVTLAAFILLYCIWQLFQAATNPPAVPPTGAPQMDDLITGVTKYVAFGLYGTLALFGTLFPALNAWYYFARARTIAQFNATTPDWVRTTLRVAA